MNGGRSIQLMVKRGIDVVLASVALVILGPAMLAIAGIIRVTSPGRALFKQTRLGLNGVQFEILKFRTMIEGAETHGTGIRTFEGDPRITPIGRFLRVTSLDELPQLLNVLRGEMSLVGPRPPVPYHPKPLSKYTSEERIRFSVRPGLTGHAQVVGRNTLSWEERFVLDAEYVSNWSLLFDVRILARTLLVFASSDMILNRKNK